MPYRWSQPGWNRSPSRSSLGSRRRALAQSQARPPTYGESRIGYGPQGTRLDSLDRMWQDMGVSWQTPQITNTLFGNTDVYARAFGVHSPGPTKNGSGFFL